MLYTFCGTRWYKVWNALVFIFLESHPWFSTWRLLYLVDCRQFRQWLLSCPKGIRHDQGLKKTGQKHARLLLSATPHAPGKREIIIHSRNTIFSGREAANEIDQPGTHHMSHTILSGLHVLMSLMLTQHKPMAFTYPQETEAQRVQ